MRAGIHLARGILIGLVLLLILRSAEPAFAGWSNVNNRPSGTMGMAQMSWQFVPIGVGAITGNASGTGGSSYTSSWSGLGAAFYFDLTNTSSVPVAISGRVAATLSAGIALVPQLRIWNCANSWNLAWGSCAGGQVAMTPAYNWNSAPEAAWATLNPGESIHLQVTTGIAIADVKLQATAKAAPTRAGMDRTAG
jgi:hypothetical protein